MRPRPFRLPTDRFGFIANIESSSRPPFVRDRRDYWRNSSLRLNAKP
jgi:hypothetical protein